MDTKQYNKLARARVIKALFPTPAETSGVTGLPEAFEAFVTQLDHVETLAARQAQRLRVTISRRDRAFAAMTDTALALSGLVFSHAARSGLDDLALDVRVKEGDFRRVRFDEKVRLAQHVHDVIAAALEAVSGAGITPAMLAEFQQAIDAGREMLPAPRNLVVDKSTATQQMAEAFRHLDAIMTDQLDPVMLPLRKRNQELYDKYRAACMLIDRAASRPVADQPPAASAAAVAEPVKLAA